MSNLLVPIKIRQDTKDDIKGVVKAKFLEEFPRLKDLEDKLTYDFLIKSMIKFYLK